MLTTGQNKTHVNHKKKSDSLLMIHVALHWKRLGEKMKLNDPGRRKLYNSGSRLSMQSCTLTYSRHNRENL